MTNPFTERLRHGEGIDGGAVLLGDSQTHETRGRVVLLRMILVAVVEGAALDLIVSVLAGLAVEFGRRRRGHNLWHVH
jgi:hypothetical protein